MCKKLQKQNACKNGKVYFGTANFNTRRSTTTPRAARAREPARTSRYVPESALRRSPHLRKDDEERKTHGVHTPLCATATLGQRTQDALIQMLELFIFQCK
jgi:hypothetical protein